MRATIAAACLALSLTGCMAATDQSAAGQASAQAPRPTTLPNLPILAGTNWRLVHFQSSDDTIGTVVPPRTERLTVRFGADGALALGLDCNRGTGRWQMTPTSPRGGSLALTMGATTRAMCPPDSYSNRLLQDLPRVRSFILADGRMSMALEADAGIYIWAPAADAGR